MAEQRHILISVYDKTGLAEFAPEVTEHNFVIVSFGRTAGTINEAGVPFIPLAEFVGRPDIGEPKDVSERMELAMEANRRLFLPHRLLSCHRDETPFDAAYVNLKPPTYDRKTGEEFRDKGGELYIRSTLDGERSALTSPDQLSGFITALSSPEAYEAYRAKLEQEAWAYLDAYDQNVKSLTARRPVTPFPGVS